MARKKKIKEQIQQYMHTDKERINNPQAGLVTPLNDPDLGNKKTWQYDPHLDPELQWAGKAEHTSFDVPTVSLHVHERIDPKRITEAVRRMSNEDAQDSLFDAHRPLREAVEFYKHRDGWSNRLVSGDSLLVMNSLIEKESMAGKVQMVYFDPPYGIKYRSNFQPFVNKSDVKDGKDEDLTSEPETIRAFRDTWELGIHSYLSYIRDRLLLIRGLLTENGSVFMQISDENVHHVREIMDEVFGQENFVSLISYKTNSPLMSKHLANANDFIVWYAKNTSKMKFNRLFEKKNIGEGTLFTYIEEKNGNRRKMTEEEKSNPKIISGENKVFFLNVLLSSGYTPSCTYDFEFENKTIKARAKSWRTHKEGMKRLIEKKRLFLPNKNSRFPYFLTYFEDYPVQEINNLWITTRSAINKSYAVQTDETVIRRCILMTTDPGDLVFDPTCGSGTTAYVAEQWGRRWVTCDTSRVATTLAKQRLMTATFDYYELAHPDEGVGSGFKYKQVPHVTLKSIANEESPATETLYDQPLKETSKNRVTGPFTVEAVPAPYSESVTNVGETQDKAPQGNGSDTSIVRSGETLRQNEWREELLRCGVRGKNGQKIMFSRVEPMPCRYLHADSETRPDDSGGKNVRDSAATADKPVRAVISFGPEHAPLEAKQVELALEEAATLRPKPTIIIFAAFQFDAEAAKDIDETNWPGVILLKIQMNTDLQTQDLKKKRSSNESFWLVGQPDVGLEQIRSGENTNKWQVEVRGFDYFNTKTGEIESGSEDRIAVWMLDTDYDGRSLYPNQVFFPMADSKGGWSKLAKSLKAEIDEDLILAYSSTVSLPFDLGERKRVAVKIVDDRGIESLKIIERMK